MFYMLIIENMAAVRTFEVMSNISSKFNLLKSVLMDIMLRKWVTKIVLLLIHSYC
jgi:hypothetical protein